MNDLDNWYSGIQVAVLGASGFIGRWVARALCGERAKVYLVVRNKEVAHDCFSKYKIQGDVIEADLRDSESIGTLFRKIRPAITFNLAGYGVDRSERNETTAYQINADLVRTTCDAIAEIRDRAWSGQDIIHVGTALEYGPIGGHLSEDSYPRPTTLYGRSKLAGTALLEERCRTLKIKGLTARLFTVYGPGEHRGRLVPSLFDTARTGKVLPLTAGSQKRDFTYVEDVAEGLLRLGLLTAPGPGEIVNLATGKLTSVRCFTKIAAEILGIPGEKLNFGAIPTREEEMEHAEVSIKRLHQLIDWVPPTSIAEGIRKTMNWENGPSNSTILRGALS